MSIFYFTKKQNEVEKWVCDMGLKVKSEVDVEQYRVDLGIEELKMAIEIDGPSHRKVTSNGKLVIKSDVQISKRDLVLLEYFSNGIFHIPVSIEEETFRKEFQKIIDNISQ